MESRLSKYVDANTERQAVDRRIYLRPWGDEPGLGSEPYLSAAIRFWAKYTEPLWFDKGTAWLDRSF
jgi:hypothetical protein